MKALAASFRSSTDKKPNLKMQLKQAVTDMMVTLTLMLRNPVGSPAAFKEITVKACHAKTTDVSLAWQW